MKKTDRTLIVIVSGIILLVVFAFAVALLRPKPTYQSESTPEGVAFNYLFALQQKDYERAYGYLSPSIKGYPADFEAFAEDVRDNSWNFNGLDNTSTSVEVDPATITGQRADVTIKITYFYESGLFNSGQYTNSHNMTLLQDESASWKITASDSYWFYCWSDPQECIPKPGNSQYESVAASLRRSSLLIETGVASERFAALPQRHI